MPLLLSIKYDYYATNKLAIKPPNPRALEDKNGEKYNSDFKKT